MVHARALKMGLPRIHLVGVDADVYRLQRASTDEMHLVPAPSDPEYIPTLKSLIRETGATLLLSNLSADMEAISAARDDLGCRVFMPDHQAILTCADKAAARAMWQQAAVPTLQSVQVRSRGSLEQAFEDFGPDLWVRAISGSGAIGSLPVSDIDSAVKWIEQNKKRTKKFIAVERPAEETTSWESVWRDGKLVVAQARRRLLRDLGDMAMAGGAGGAGAGETVADSAIDRLGMNAVRALSARPHGVMSVDIGHNRKGEPRVMSVIAGRFMSGGVCHFAATDFNIPAVAADIALGSRPDFSPPLLDPLKPGVIFISGLDKEPVFTTRAELDRIRNELAERKSGSTRPAVLAR